MSYLPLQPFHSFEEDGVKKFKGFNYFRSLEIFESSIIFAEEEALDMFPLFICGIHCNIISHSGIHCNTFRLYYYIPGILLILFPFFFLWFMILLVSLLIIGDICSIECK